MMKPDQRQFFTLAEWQVRPGSEEAFVTAWEDLGKVFGDLPGSPAPEGFLLRSLEDPLRFYSFGPWKDLESIQAMRADPTAKAAIEKVRALCTESRPGAYELVHHVKTA